MEFPFSFVWKEILNGQTLLIRSVLPSFLTLFLLLTHMPSVFLSSFNSLSPFLLYTHTHTNGERLTWWIPCRAVSVRPGEFMRAPQPLLLIKLIVNLFHKQIPLKSYGFNRLWLKYYPNRKALRLAVDPDMQNRVRYVLPVIGNVWLLSAYWLRCPYKTANWFISHTVNQSSMSHLLLTMHMLCFAARLPNCKSNLEIKVEL